jgi:hypothetical protein
MRTRLEAGEVARTAWQIYAQNFGGFVVASLILLVVAVPLLIAGLLVPVGLAASHIIAVKLLGKALSHLVVLLVVAFVTAGYYRYALRFIAPSIDESDVTGSGGYGILFSIRGVFTVTVLSVVVESPRLLESALEAIGTASGSPMLILVGQLLGIVLYLPLLLLAPAGSLVSMFAIDRGLGLMASVQEARRVASGQLGPILHTLLVGVLVLIAGAAACGIGLYVAIPVFHLMIPVMYVRLREIAPAPQGIAALSFGG